MPKQKPKNNEPQDREATALEVLQAKFDELQRDASKIAHDHDSLKLKHTELTQSHHSKIDECNELKDKILGIDKHNRNLDLTLKLERESKRSIILAMQVASGQHAALPFDVK